MSVATRPATSSIATVLLLASALGLAGCHREPPGPVEEQRRQADATWIAPLDAAIGRIDHAMPGDFGVFVSRFGDAAGTLDRGADRAWYLSSTIKVPVAIAVLEAVDAGRLSLDEALVLAGSDYVDGAGDLLHHDPGAHLSIATLLEKSLRDSDSTATDMLIRRIGEDHLNQRIGNWIGDGFGPVTTILQVRYDAYGPLHPGVADLDNMQMLSLRNAEAGEPRLQALAQLLDVSRSELRTDSLQAAFDTYYAGGNNSATLSAFARLIERVLAGELLTPDSTDLLLSHMRAITTGDSRISAGLPTGTDFAQKTGTQLGRACNVGVIDAEHGTDGATVVVACAEDFEDLAQAEQAFVALGRALGELPAPAGGT